MVTGRAIREDKRTHLRKLESEGAIVDYGLEGQFNVVCNNHRNTTHAHCLEKPHTPQFPAWWCETKH